MNGDVVVCSVSQDEYIEDISRMVPKGEATHIPGELAAKSRDLNTLLSQSRLIRLKINPLVRSMRAPVVEPPSPGVDELYSRALVENEQIRAELNRVRAENSTLRVELGHVRAHNDKLKENSDNSDKLDTILKVLKEMPAGVTLSTSGGEKSPTSLLEDIPLYIPSQIKSDSTEGRVSVSEETADASSLSGASKALREKRKKQQ